MAQAAVCDLPGDILKEFLVSFEEEILAFVEMFIAEYGIEGSRLLGSGCPIPSESTRRGLGPGILRCLRHGCDQVHNPPE
jgi:hypothetical protein